MKYCKDCIYYKAIWRRSDPVTRFINTMACIKNVKRKINIVDGSPYYDTEPLYPDMERNNPNSCGAIATNYKRKWWKFWAEK